MNSKKIEDMQEQIQKQAMELESSDRNVGGILALMILLISISMSLYHFVTAGFGLLVGSRSHLILHLTMALTLVFLIYPIKKGLNQRTIPWYDLLLALFASSVGAYIIFNQQSPSILSARMTTMDLAVAISLLFLVVEATRRVVGKPLVIIAGLFTAYFFLGAYLLPPFRHSRADFHDFFYEMAFTTTGLFSTPIWVSANYVFIFILFGAILEATGAGKMFIDLALRAFGKYRGGPAKAAVLSSGMLGSISGSSVANAVTTGTFTIPLMKKVGFKPHVAGGIEVAASSSGQLLPPIMGAAAFLMIEYTGHSYIEIIRSAAIPAILSYTAILLMVHFEAAKNNIRGLSPHELVSARSTLLQQGYLLLPLMILVFFLAKGQTVPNAAFFAIIILLSLAFFANHFRERFGAGMAIAASLFLLSYGLHYFLNWKIEIAAMILLGTFIALLFILLQRKYQIEGSPVRFGLRELAAGFEMAARNSLSVVVACATAGILIGVVNLTGLSSKLPHMIVGFSEDIVAFVPFFSGSDMQLYIALILTVIACLIMGLGLPTTATYVVLASMIAPALVMLGLPIMAAHLFVLYYGILADDTPPINLPAYATAGIAKAEPLRTGIQGFKFDSGALLLPFVFATNPTILLLNPEATWVQVTLNIFTAFIGIVAFSSFIQRWLLSEYRWYERLLALVAALVLVHGSFITDTVGIAILLFLFVSQYYRKKKGQQTVPSQELPTTTPH
ncbi:TRAP transporter permease [Heliorestis convoluta]|uniref:TRAP transporter permease n=1 Tax=Heliorestis convoluta TaxID=356322 RepID=A0A5Q2N5L1_9FIRM|nr:TRAP transporter permease [Heliorestis convoluta]QGG48622.1 TRAP transporter permease [Heliorestis convoluta]